jgi:hypothetical protein
MARAWPAEGRLLAAEKQRVLLVTCFGSSRPRPVRHGTRSQTGWPLACEELMVKTHPSGPMISNES